jgi:hypothetical protein
LDSPFRSAWNCLPNFLLSYAFLIFTFSCFTSLLDSGSGFPPPRILCGTKLSILSKTISLKVPISHPHNYHLLPILLIYGDRSSTVVNVLRYKSEGRWFDPRWCHGNFQWHKSFWSHYGPGVNSASNRNEYREYFLGVNAASS